VKSLAQKALGIDYLRTFAKPKNCECFGFSGFSPSPHNTVISGYISIRPHVGGLAF